MAIFEHKIRVRYAECDSMGFVHHSVYATYYEEARTEAMRSLGLNYREMENNGIIMPVRSMEFLFKKAAFYDDLITVKVYLLPPSGLRYIFTYETFNEKEELLNTGKTELFFADRQTLKPIQLPGEYQIKIP